MISGLDISEKSRIDITFRFLKHKSKDSMIALPIGPFFEGNRQMQVKGLTWVRHLNVE